MKRQTLLPLIALALAGTAGGVALAQQGSHQGHGQHGTRAQGSAASQHDLSHHHRDVGPAQPWHAALHDAVHGENRTPANVARDQYRHPFDTLAFFGVQPNHNVVEIWPGAGWYTEILAPYLGRGGGSYQAVAGARQLARVEAMVAANPGLYGQVRTAAFPVRAAEDRRVPDNSVDVVLTFRNVHNWMMGEQPFADEAFRQMYAMLKPGGVLGVVEHRLPENGDAARERSSGYVRTSTVRRLAEAAGFELVRSSEINANPRDTADHPQGVWTLPPTYRLGDTDRARYQAIGESDRMTLLFRKPA